MYTILTDGRSTNCQHIFNDKDGKLAKFLAYLRDNCCLNSSVNWKTVEALENLVVDLDEE